MIASKEVKYHNNNNLGEYTEKLANVGRVLATATRTRPARVGPASAESGWQRGPN